MDISKKFEIVKNIIQLYHKNGHIKNIFEENITQLEHSIQSAIYAEVFVNNLYFLHAILPDYNISKNELKLLDEINYNKNNIIVATLLHNIGYLLKFEKDNIKSYDIIGSNYLKSLGFNDLIEYLIKSHIPAKRYMITVNERYKENININSLKNLEYKGGKMNIEEINNFKKNKYYIYAIILTLSVEYIKVPNTNLQYIGYYTDLILNCIK